MGVPVPQWRAHLPGQRVAYAPSGAEAGRAAQGAVSRLAPHLRHPGPAKRGGRKNGVRDAGPLLRGFHPGHLRPHYQCRPASGGADDGECAGGDGTELRNSNANMCPIAAGITKFQRLLANRWNFTALYWGNSTSKAE